MLKDNEKKSYRTSQLKVIKKSKGEAKPKYQKVGAYYELSYTKDRSLLVKQDFSCEKESVQEIVEPKPFFLDRLTAHFNSCWIYYIAPILIFALFMAVLYSFNIYPFSTDCMSNYDLLAQICPFIEHFYDVFNGKSSLFYSTAIMGGADVFGTLAYCCVSPFTFLFLLFGQGNVYYAVSFVLPLKLSCVAISAMFFLRKSFKNIPDYVVLIVSLLYAYCGYMFVANTYINWVDFLIYMPFVVLGFKRLVKEKKIRYFSIAYALMVYTCFSISSFAMILIFLIFVAYAFIVCEGEERWEVLAKSCISLVLVVAICLPLMVPAFVAYAKSGRNTGLFENMANELDATHLYAKMSYIFSDTLCLFCSIVYFIRFGVKDKKNKFLLLTGVLIMLPVLIDEVNNLLNAGSYMSYALRFGFLNATYMLYLTGALLNSLKERAKKPTILTTVCTVLFASLAVIAVLYIMTFNSDILEENLYDFSSIFAHSVGGLEVIAVVAGVIGGLLIIGSLLYYFKLTSLKAITYVLIAVFSVQISFYNIHLVKGNAFNPVRYEQFNAISDIIKENYESEEDGYYYRIKDYDDAITNVASFTTHTNCFSVFSSVIDADNFVAPMFFGYDGNNVNCMKSSGGLFIGDSILGYKYYYIHNDRSEYHRSTRRTYNELLKDTQQSYFQGVKNEICFPNAYTTKSGDLKFSGSYYDDLQKLYNFLGGEGELFEDYEISPFKITYNETTKVYTIKVYLVAEGQWYLTHDFPEEYDIYYAYSNYNESNRFKLEEDTVINFNYHEEAPNSYFYLYVKDYGDDTSLTQAKIAEFCKGRLLPLAKIEELNELLHSRAAKYKIENGNKYVVSATAEDDETYLFMNYVAIDGFDIKVNGKDAEFIDNDLKFMLVKLEKGRNDVVIQYSSPYIKYGLVGVCLSAIIIFLLWLGVKKFPKVYKMFRNTICVMAVALAFAITAFFIVYPSTLFFFKLFKLLIF